jgi:hypothetical protein
MNKPSAKDGAQACSFRAQDFAEGPRSLKGRWCERAQCTRGRSTLPLQNDSHTNTAFSRGSQEDLR